MVDVNLDLVMGDATKKLTAFEEYYLTLFEVRWRAKMFLGSGAWPLLR
jgi:hypothetical protein